jgi:hypothetical protein
MQYRNLRQLQAKRNPGLARARGVGSALIGNASVSVTCVVRHYLCVSRGSVWPRTRGAFLAKLEARYRLAFSVLQAANRNGGGAFVAFVVAGGRAVIIWRLYMYNMAALCKSYSFIYYIYGLIICKCIYRN